MKALTQTSPDTDSIDRLASYTAAGCFPTKLLQQAVVQKGKIVPYHVQLNPTNACNLRCPFCSCSERERELSVPMSEMMEMIRMFAGLGTRAVTITGGGEPMLYPNLNEMIRTCNGHGIAVGLVTNGTLLGRLEEQPTWVRISFDDLRALDRRFAQTVESAVRWLPESDWAFSYVLGSKPKIPTIKGVLKLAADNGFTHVRLVSDLLDLEAVPDMQQMQRLLRDANGEPLVIYQGRKQYTAGRTDCLISLAKPVVGADGNLYPCCGTQYAIDPPPRDYAAVMSMGHWREFPAVFNEQRHFDGSICSRCYYDDYNMALGLMTTPVAHGVFI